MKHAELCAPYSPAPSDGAPAQVAQPVKRAHPAAAAATASHLATDAAAAATVAAATAAAATAAATTAAAAADAAADAVSFTWMQANPKYGSASITLSECDDSGYARARSRGSPFITPNSG